MSKNTPNVHSDLIKCEDEPIHLTEHIHTFGFLLVLSLPDYTITQCSANTGSFIGMEPSEIMDTPLENLLPQKDFQKVKHLIQEEQELYSSPLDLCFLKSDKLLKISFHFSQGLLILEGEEIIENIKDVSYYYASNHFMKQLNTSKNLANASDVAVELIKKISGYDRVMIYEFDEQWNGKVIAESKKDKLSPFLGHHFPASDIPKQARKLYLKNLLRVIPDIAYTPVALVPAVNPKLKAPLDLSYAILRSTSPVHIEYLQNMGVRATLTISIIVQNQLWGLVACHHYSTKKIDPTLRSLLEHFAHLLAHQIKVIDESDKKNLEIKIQKNEKELIKVIAQEKDFFKSLYNNIPMLLKLNTAHGIAISYEQNFCKFGAVPDRKFIDRLIDWLFIHQTEHVFHTHQLSELLPEALQHGSTASGILAIRLSKYEKNFLIWFKPETSQTITWGGNPNEKEMITAQDGTIRLSPRKSFEKWEQVVKNMAIKWEKNEIRFAESFRYFLVELIANQTSFLETQKLHLAITIQEKTLEIRQAHQRLQEINEQVLQQNEELRTQNEQISKLYTELDKNKAQLKAVLDNTKHIFLYLDLRGRLLFFNEIAEKSALNLLSKELKIGDYLKYFTINPKEKEKLDGAFQKALKGEFIIIESAIHHPESKDRRWFRIEFNPVRDQGNIKGVVVLMIDITELKEASLLIQEQNKHLREIAYIQSHEVRKPVANIIGLVSLFNHDDPSDSFNKTVLEKLDTSIKDLDGIIGQIVENTYMLNKDLHKIAHR